MWLAHMYTHATYVMCTQHACIVHYNFVICNVMCFGMDLSPST